MCQIREWRDGKQRVIYEDIANVEIAFSLWNAFRSIKPAQVFSIYITRKK